jgi:hypothetical protein
MEMAPPLTLYRSRSMPRCLPRYQACQAKAVLLAGGAGLLVDDLHARGDRHDFVVQLAFGLRTLRKAVYEN